MEVVVWYLHTWVFYFVLVLKLCGNRRAVVSTLKKTLTFVRSSLEERLLCFWIGFTRMVGGVIAMDSVLCRWCRFGCLPVLNCVGVK